MPDEIEFDPITQHWHKPWPERSFAPETNRKILERIAAQEQAQLLTEIQKLRQTTSHEWIEGAIIGGSKFELSTNLLVVYRIAYLAKQGWPKVHQDLLDNICTQCAPAVVIIETKKPTPPD